MRVRWIAAPLDALYEKWCCAFWIMPEMDVMFRMVPDQPSWRSEDFCRRGRKAAVGVVSGHELKKGWWRKVIYQM